MWPRSRGGRCQAYTWPRFCPSLPRSHLLGDSYRPYEISRLAPGEPFFGHHLSESGCELDAQVPKVRQVFVRVLESWFDQTRSPFSYLLGENGQVFLA